MQKTIYLHIGYHKTGTTAIQTTLLIHRQLLQKHGYYYPKIGIIGEGHHNIGWELQSVQLFVASNGTLQQLLDEVDQQPDVSVIISSEEFSRLTRHQIQKLADAFMKHDVKIIVYLRRQDQFLQSIWAQTVKTGKQKQSFNTWLDKAVFKHIEDDPNYENSHQKLNYAFTIAMWAEAFGESNIRVRVYDKTIKNILEDFLLTCDMQDTRWMPDPARSNESPGIKTLETIRLISNSLSSLPKNVQQSSTYSILFQNLREQSTILGWNTDELRLITPEIYSKIIEPLAESNKEVAQKYLGRDILFIDHSIPDETLSFDIKTMNAEEFIEVFAPALEEIITQASLLNRSDGIKQRIMSLSYNFPKILNLINRYPRLSNYLKMIVRRLS